MSIAGSLIGAGGSLIGGLLGKQKGYSPREQGLGHVEGMMQASEAFGINPLFLLGNVAAGGGIPSQNYMGSAIADAAMLLGDAVSKNKEKQQLTQKNEQIAKLQKRIDNLTLRPKVGGIYAQNEQTPTIGSALGRGGDASAIQTVARGNGSSGGSAGAGGAAGVSRPLMETSALDSRRDVDNAPIKTGPGVMVIDNEWLPAPAYVPTLDGDEPLNWYDYPSLIVPGATMAVGWAADKGKRDRQAYIDRNGKSPREALAEQYANSVAYARGITDAVTGGVKRKIHKKPKS